MQKIKQHKWQNKTRSGSHGSFPWEIFFYDLLSGYLMTETANIIPTTLRTKLKRLHRELNYPGHSASALSAAICCCQAFKFSNLFIVKCLSCWNKWDLHDMTWCDFWSMQFLSFDISTLCLFTKHRMITHSINWTISHFKWDTTKRTPFMWSQDFVKWR